MFHHLIFIINILWMYSLFGVFSSKEAFMLSNDGKMLFQGTYKEILQVKMENQDTKKSQVKSNRREHGAPGHLYTKAKEVLNMSRDMTKPTKWVCAQRRLRSAWASVQSDQSSLSARRKLGSLATHWVHSENLDQTGRMPGWSESSLGAHSFCWFCHVITKENVIVGEKG